jgi:hypothetical protein
MLVRQPLGLTLLRSMMINSQSRPCSCFQITYGRRTDCFLYVI